MLIGDFKASVPIGEKDKPSHGSNIASVASWPGQEIGGEQNGAVAVVFIDSEVPGKGISAIKVDCASQFIPIVIGEGGWVPC